MVDAALLARIVVADVGLRLLRDEARLLAEMREALAVIVAVALFMETMDSTVIIASSTISPSEMMSAKLSVR